MLQWAIYSAFVTGLLLGAVGALVAVKTQRGKEEAAPLVLAVLAALQVSLLLRFLLGLRFSFSDVRWAVICGLVFFVLILPLRTVFKYVLKDQNVFRSSFDSCVRLLFKCALVAFGVFCSYEATSGSAESIRALAMVGLGSLLVIFEVLNDDKA